MNSDRTPPPNIDTSSPILILLLNIGNYGKNAFRYIYMNESNKLVHLRLSHHTNIHDRHVFPDCLAKGAAQTDDTAHIYLSH